MARGVATRKRRRSRRGARSGELSCRGRLAKLLCDADLRVQVPGRACVRQVLPGDEQQSPPEVPYLRQDGGATDLGRVRVGVQGLRLLHNRLQAGRREAGGDGGHEAGGRVQAQPRVEAQLRVEACGRDEARRARQEEKRLRRQVKAHEVIRAALADAAARLGASVSAGAIELERPRDPAHGDVATNLALTLAKSLKQKPRAVAERLVAGLALPQGLVRKIDVAGPGFINFHLAEAQLASVLEAVLEAGARYRPSGAGQGRPVNVEFVSANPTGPLHVGHGRQAALGDAIASLLQPTGWRRTRGIYLQ